MINKVVLSAIALGVMSHTVHANEQTKANNGKAAFTLPTEYVNSQPQTITKQQLFDVAIGNVPKEPMSPAMQTMDPSTEINSIGKGSGIAREEDFPGYNVQDVPMAGGPSYSFLNVVKSKYKSKQEFKGLEPGANIAIPVAVGLTNPIITNFKMVAVRTHDEDSVIELEAGRAYITINSMKPVALMLFEEGVPESMINVTLVPMEAMPVIMDLDIDLSANQIEKGRVHRAKMKELEAIALAQASELPAARGQDTRINRIKQILIPVGRGEVPQGFSLSTDTSFAMRKPCGMTISQSVQQRIVGPREVVDVVRVKNNTGRPYTIREQMCESRDVIAVAIYNKSLLQPGEATEVYILRDKLYANKAPRQNNKRPRVIN